jgi:flavin reductase (DIM6/NTAB) family NADH-FMN oxidoreductase RutF
MRSVRISLKTARTIVRALDEAGEFLAAAASEELRAAMAPKKFVKAARKVKAAKKKVKRDESAEIRAAVMKRAAGACESCGAQETNLQRLEWDHFFGRVRVPQSERSTWALCGSCHRKKTLNEPSAVSWLMEFAGHARANSFHDEAGMAMRRMRAIELSRRSA